ncbi:unnamed protein product [Psylliodes chrysocephalus]|uniref:BAH domain-containing protein n=1 Tax=Psylliodes chrysocephalus TaxID=3402493 RepID=A0A9P0GEL7_9CUCU|nr:unnamed protein product [Psylliodes chrysocephala]
MLGSPSGSGVPTQRGLWPLGTVQAPTITTFSNDGFNKYGVYSLFPGGPSFGSTLYSHSSTSSTTGRFAAAGQYQPPSENIFHTSYKVSDSLFSTTSYTFGAPTPPPGSPYSPVPVGQLELFAKGMNTGILQPIDGGILQTTKKIQDKYCEKCCNFKSQVCNCQVIIPEHKLTDPIQCCTRTTPIKWNEINLKKEPLGQISEISTNSASMIKLEVMSPTQTTDIIGGNYVSLTEPSRSANTMSVNSTTMTSSQTDSAMIHCIDDKTSGIGTRHMEETSYMASPTMWQYSTPVAPIPVEPILPVPVPPLVVRDPNTGGYLLVSTSGLDSLQQTVVWPGYPQHSSVILPSLPPVPSPSFQLLPPGASHCFSGTSFHQQTQAHSTRLVAVTTDNKRKIPLQIPATTLIKIEADQPKSLQPISTSPSSTATVITDVTPLITTHVIYQHPTNFIVSQSPASEIGTQTTCKSQATSPVACLTPPPELQTKEVKISSVQDASNQTDAVMGNDEPTALVLDVLEKPATPNTMLELPEKTLILEKIEEPQVVQEPELQEVSKVPQKLALTAGLELLSNSIDQFESSVNHTENLPEKEEPKSATLEGLDLLCALAEQRILEENENPVVEAESFRKRKKEKRKSKKHSYDEPKRKKLKSDKHHDKKKHKKNYKLERECPCQGSYEIFKAPDQEENTKNPNDKSQIVFNDGNVKEEWLLSDKSESDVKVINPEDEHRTPENKSEITIVQPKKINFVKKHFRSKSADFDHRIISSLNNNFLPLLKPPVLTETPKFETKHKIDENDFDTSPEKQPSTQKRKVGRPKKLMPFSKEQVTTETIVSKKPKSNLIGYFLAAKEKFRLQNKESLCENTDRYLEEETPIKRKTSKKKHSFIGDLKTSKIKPKLKAEPTFKSFEDRESVEEFDEDDQNNSVIIKIKSNLVEIQDKHGDQKEDQEREESFLKMKQNPEERRCVLTAELLKVDKLRVLTAMGGLFYAGQLNAIEPPDVYSIVLDGERGNKPHIMSREEILRDAIVEVSPQNVSELLVGTRVCAYWSQQYRCLYPGSIAEPTSPDSELDNKFVLVEFDDGDSGRIDLKDIRLLPSDYPVIEYDLNPLLSLMKRKKKPSKTKDVTEPEVIETREQIPERIKMTIDKVDEPEKLKECRQEKHFKKKLLKRIKREKMIQEEKRKKKKHKCYDRKGKERKHHKKHRKHKKRHEKNKTSKNEMGVEENNEIILETSMKPDFSEEKVLFIKPSEENEIKVNINTSIEDEKEDTLVVNTEVSNKKKTNMRDRQESCESRSKMSAFLPARQLWGWAGKEYKRQRVRGRFKKFFYKSIQRGKEVITVGDSAVFLSTGRPDRPYIGKIEAMWELFGTMIVKVKWFYHPEETIGCPQNLQYPGALFESPHIDENDVQTISHKCDVVPLEQYRQRLGDDPENYATIYDNNDIYYLAGYYDPTSCIMKMEPGIPFAKTN